MLYHSSAHEAACTGHEDCFLITQSTLSNRIKTSKYLDIIVVFVIYETPATRSHPSHPEKCNSGSSLGNANGSCNCRHFGSLVLNVTAPF
ncbi:hypothetical protein EMIT0357P_10228 [Pseudomonas marginalis]